MYFEKPFRPNRQYSISLNGQPHSWGGSFHKFRKLFSLSPIHHNEIPKKNNKKAGKKFLVDLEVLKTQTTDCSLLVCKITKI